MKNADDAPAPDATPSSDNATQNVDVDGGFVPCPDCIPGRWANLVGALFPPLTDGAGLTFRYRCCTCKREWAETQTWEEFRAACEVPRRTYLDFASMPAPNWKRDGNRIVVRHDIMDRLESLRETARLMEVDDVSPDPRRAVMNSHSDAMRFSIPRASLRDRIRWALAALRRGDIRSAWRLFRRGVVTHGFVAAPFVNSRPTP